MDRYIIYCTETQIKKAIELEAPIEYTQERLIDSCFKPVIPTAEQMIGWLEEQEILIDVEMRTGITYVYDRLNKVFIKSIKIPSRPEAIRAAIDVALNYLTNNK